MNEKELTLREKISQMFIVGFNGTKFSFNKYFNQLVENGLGGVIFFTHNIQSEKQFKELIYSLSQDCSIPMFYSIDQEGGRVERTEKIHNGKKYLSAKEAYEMGLSYLQSQTKDIALELKGYGINMNFAPVLDVNTNEKNPIIGDRAFSNDTNEVVAAGKVVIKEYEKYSIITVGKHFPGHGDSSSDSHQTLPIIGLSTEQMQEHIKPFKEAISIGLPCIMAAHVLYPNLDDTNTPASISKQIIKDILRNELKFEGVIISDDMEMNGIKGYTKLDACIKGINAGVDMFIFRDATKEVFDLIEALEKAVNNGIIKEENINKSVERIFNLKKKYEIIK